MPGVATQPTHRWIYAIGTVVIVMLSAAVVLLMIKYNALRTQLRTTPSYNILDELKPGDRLTPIEAQSIDGLPTTITYTESGMSYLILVFSTTCPYCEENIEKWRRIAGPCQEGGCSVIGVSVHGIEPTRQYLLDRNVPFYTVINTRREFTEAYKISGVPMTILISAGGIVENTWSGMINDEQVDEIIDRIQPASSRSSH